MKDIESELKVIETKRPNGQTVRCLIDIPHLVRDDSPLVIIVPPYAKTMCEVTTTSLFLTSNGFMSLRFDYSNHIGASDGNIYDFTLSSAIEDVQTVIAAIRSRFKKTPLGIICSSLGSRIVFRALKDREDIDVVVSLVGVVNLQYTLGSIIGEDLIGKRLANQLLPSSREVLGYEINTDFINDAVNKGLYSLDSTKQDAFTCTFPIVQIAAEFDSWTLLNEVEEVFGAENSENLYELYLLKGASHKLENNPSAAREALCLAIQTLNLYLCKQRIQLSEITCPSFAKIVKKIRQERILERSGYQTAMHYY